MIRDRFLAFLSLSLSSLFSVRFSFFLFFPHPRIPKEESLARVSLRRGAKRVDGKLFTVAVLATESDGVGGKQRGGGLKANRRRFRFNDRYGTV